MEADDALGNSLTDGHDLGSGTTSSHSNTQVKILEPVSSEQKNGFHGLEPHGGWLECIKRSSIDSDES